MYYSNTRYVTFQFISQAGIAVNHGSTVTTTSINCDINLTVYEIYGCKWFERQFLLTDVLIVISDKERLNKKFKC